MSASVEVAAREAGMEEIIARVSIAVLSLLVIGFLLTRR